MTTAPRALLVDYGGVLTTGVPQAFAAFCRTEGLPEDLASHCLEADGQTIDALRLLERGDLRGRDFEVTLARRLSELSGRSVTATELLRRLIAELEPEPTLPVAIAALRSSGVRTALLSNSMGRRGYPWEALEPLFDDVVLSCDVGLAKPDVAIYRLAAERLEVPASACVMIDDVSRNIAGAESAGMAGIHHTSPDATIRALAERFDVALDPTGS